MSAREGFGKAKEGSGLEILKVGEGETKQFRIFPPKGGLVKSGRYSVYIQQHYGYNIPDPKDPTKTRPRPFSCVEEKDGDKVVVSCPECRKIEDKKRLVEEQHAAEMARLIGQGEDKTIAKQQADKFVASHEEWLKAHNLDRKWYLIAMGEDGRIGYLVIPHKAKKAMDVEKKKLLADEKIDVLDLDNGAWVEITRTGKGRNTEYTARIAQEQVVSPTGVRAKITKVSGFSEQQLEEALAMPDLDSSALVRKISRDQVRMLVEGTGEPEEVEAILNMGQKTDAKRREEPAPSRREESPAPLPAPSREPTRTGASGGAESAPVAIDQAATIAALQAQLAALIGGGNTKPAPVLKTPSNPTPVADVRGMTDEEFLAKFGAK